MTTITKEQAQEKINELEKIGIEYAKFAGMNLEIDWLPAKFDEAGADVVEFYTEKLSGSVEKAQIELARKTNQYGFSHGENVAENAVSIVKKIVRYLATNAQRAGMEVSLDQYGS